MAPSDLQEYGGFIAALVGQVVQRYGRQKAQSFWWRVATEPNTGRGGTGQDVPAPDARKIEVYADYYVAVCAAITSVLPAAVVGPGNFASWWQMGMGSNASTGKHANQGLNLIAPMLQTILAKGGTIGFLAASFYASEHGNEVGTNISCAECGYDPRQARAAGEGLRYLRGVAPQLAAVPLQVQEFAAVGTGRHGISFEPGAFGGAWTLAACVEFAAQGVDRVFHWDIGAGTGGYDVSNALDPNGHMLFFSNAWVIAAARKLFGPSADSLVSILTTHSALYGNGRSTCCSRSCMLQARRNTRKKCNTKSKGVGKSLTHGD